MPQGSPSLRCSCPQGAHVTESPCPREPQPRGCLSTPIMVYRWPEGFIPSLMLWQGEAPHKGALGVWVSPEHHPPASLPCGSPHIVRAPSQHAGLLHRLPSVAPIRVQNRQEDSLAWGCEGAQACTPGLGGCWGCPESLEVRRSPALLVQCTGAPIPRGPEPSLGWKQSGFTAPSHISGACAALLRGNRFVAVVNAISALRHLKLPHPYARAADV